MFWDDNIGANPRYAKELFRALTPLRKWWTSQCTANAARDEEFIELAARSGCKALFLGLESISQESLEGTNKAHNRVDDYRRLIANLHRHGIAVHLGDHVRVRPGRRWDLPPHGRLPRRGLRRCRDREHGRADAWDSDFPPPERRRKDPDHRLVEVRREETLRLRARPHVAAELEAGTEWVARRFYSPRSIVRRLAGSRAGVWWNLPRNVGYMLAGLWNRGLTTPSAAAPS